ncbi:MAG: PLP-dependent aminotransferase family protein, partial [Rubrivivax sp.]
AKTLDTRELARRLLERGVVVEPGDVFYPSAGRPCNQMRIGYSSIATERIDAGVRVIADVLDEFRA